MLNKQSGGVSEDFGKLILRVTLALLILFHGVSKVIHGPGAVLGAVAKFGMPPAVGYLVYIGEVIAPLLILFGVWTRPAALIVAINMIVAVILVHTSQIFTMSKMGGWALELQGMYLASALTVALIGGGRFAIGGRWN